MLSQFGSRRRPFWLGLVGRFFYPFHRNDSCGSGSISLRSNVREDRGDSLFSFSRCPLCVTVKWLTINFSWINPLAEDAEA
jgi:hypothetical protein